MAIDLPDLLSECAAFSHAAVASLSGLIANNGSGLPGALAVFVSIALLSLLFCVASKAKRHIAAQEEAMQEHVAASEARAVQHREEVAELQRTKAAEVERELSEMRRNMDQRLSAAATDWGKVAQQFVSGEGREGGGGGGGGGGGANYPKTTR